MFWGSWNVLDLGLGGCPTCENSAKSNEGVSALHCLATVQQGQYLRGPRWRIKTQSYKPQLSVSLVSAAQSRK